jgi:hypothetical protein
VCGLALASTSAGCAFSYVDSSNVRHVIGFVDVARPAAPAEASRPTPSVVSVTSVGMHVYSGGYNGSGVMLGYGKETVLTMPDNTCVDLSAPGPCATRVASPFRTDDRKAPK